MIVGRSVLITGGAGFIGLNLLDELTKQEIPAVVVDRRMGEGVPERLRRHSRIEWREGDILNPLDWGSLLNDIKHIVHLASETNVVESTARPRDHFLPMWPEC